MLVSFYIFGKAINHKPSGLHKTISVFWCIIWALIHSLEPVWTPLLMIRVMFCVASILLIWVMLKMKFDIAISAFLLANGASIPLYSLAFVPVAIIFAPFLSAGFSDDAMIDRSNPIHILFFFLIAALQFVIANRFFMIRRFKRGFHFLFGRLTVVVALVFAGLALSIFTSAVAQRDAKYSYIVGIPLVAGAIIVGAGIVIWVRWSIKAAQRKWAKEDNAVILQKEADDLQAQLAKQIAVNENLRAANHSLNHRLASAERSIIGMLEKHRQMVSEKISEDFSRIISDIRKLSEEHAVDVGREKLDVVLPSTNIKTIDDMLGLFADRFADGNIMFKLMVTGSIVYMTENTITLGLLETMIADHLQNALIAVNASDASIRSVLAMIGEVGDFYEFSVYDSGIPFDVDTLIRLGTERVTTHEADGGSGVGFMKTFETMRERKASLIIGESKSGVYTKSVTIRFDGEGQYIIDTYRHGDFPPSDRYIVTGH
jgi:signal transduction histidine kinase